MKAPDADEVILLVSEDVRPELSGRSSFMGVFGPSIEVAKVPTLIPTLCASVLIRNPREPIRQIEATVHGPSGKLLLKSAPALIGDIAPPLPYMSVHSIKAFPVLIDAEGDLRFVFTFNGRADVGVEASIRVRVAGPALP